MGKRKKLYPKAEDELDSLKQETAEKLNLDDDIEKRGWENMTTREVDKVGGNMVKKMIKFAEKEMDERDGKIDEED